MHGLVPLLPGLAALCVCANGAWSQECTELSKDVSRKDQFEFRFEDTPRYEAIPPQARIGNIEIVRFNVFDLQNPKDQVWYGRLANRVHAVSKEWVIRDVLLFTEGDTWNRQKLEESERLLRDKDYLYDARIRPVRLCGDRIDIKVIVRDTWTLTGGATFSRSGGENKSGFFINDDNLLGRGINLFLGRENDEDRSGYSLKFSDRELFGSRWQLASEWADNEDGFARNVSLQHPFYSLNTHHAYGLFVREVKQDDKLYFRSEEVEKFAHDFNEAEINYGFSPGLQDSITRRWQVGWHYERHHFAAGEDTRNPLLVPENRARSYWWVEREHTEDQYIVEKNITSFARSENIYVGEHYKFRVGATVNGMGADKSMWYLSGFYRNAYRPLSDSLLFWDTGGEGFWDKSESDWENLSTWSEWRWFLSPFEKRQWLLRFRLDYARNLTREKQLLLGGREGLRGFPSRFQAGDRSFLFSAERRLFYDYHLFRLFYLGSALFVDVGRAWYNDRDNGENGGVLANVGFGLRVTSSRFRSDRVLHIDVGFPLQSGNNIDDVQISIRGRKRF